MSENFNQNPTPEITMTVEDAAKSLNVSTATVLRWLKAKKLNGWFRVGRKWLIRQADFDQFLKQKSEENI